MIYSLIPHGENYALVIDKALLQAAGLDETKALFQITLDPNGGILIQSVKSLNEKLHEKAFTQILMENAALLKRLTQR